ncbi:helix-turn-helix transcriptional regulator [uncultured Microbacterium sp.]|uniref:helix-turn-helix transcriptional regulator n=1 Tax=uncultured Microbacterium sp. TaxID=191216 RepID=UPI0035CC99BB
MRRLELPVTRERGATTTFTHRSDYSSWWSRFSNSRPDQVRISRRGWYSHCPLVTSRYDIEMTHGKSRIVRARSCLVGGSVLHFDSHRADHRAVLAHLIARVLRSARARAGLTQEQVAHSAGIAVITYGSLERARSSRGAGSNPTLETISRVFNVLNIDLDDLASGIDSQGLVENEVSG